jgi:hypothetical protein
MGCTERPGEPRRPAGRHLNTAPDDNDDVDDGCLSVGHPKVYGGARRC